VKLCCRIIGLLVLSSLCFGSQAEAQGHPGVFITAREGAAIRAAAGKYPVLDSSLAEARRIVENALAHPTDVPQPGEAGGYAHERHKQNYREMQLAGELFVITGDVRYARFVRDMLEKYAVLYPTLPPHPLAGNQAPGKLFHQSLNEANWLLATAIAYDCVYDWLKPAERARFEANVFRPMADWLSVNQAKEFDRIHNHGTWATAAVGTIGLVMRDSSYVNRALYGTKRNHTGGFLRQLDLLFSPDGYYMEGPYYIRYALMPFFYFAEAVNREEPAVGIYKYRNGILKKALGSAIGTAFPNGVFPAINDASRTMAIDAPEVVVALDLGLHEYGADPRLLGAAAIQHEVVLNGAGLEVARDLATRHTLPVLNQGSVEYSDGPDGNEGGLGILRSGSGRGATMLLMKYGVHGGGHGHFDLLHFVFFDDGREVIPDYGFSRWINIEPKSGGRYLPENDSYASQTIAHNTVVVDETSQSEAKESAAEAVSGERRFFDASNPDVQVMSAEADKQYPGVRMQRTMFLLRDARLSRPAVVDVFNVQSGSAHQYDYPIHFRGQLIATNAKYTANTTRQEPVGRNFGYQHLWDEADGQVNGDAKLTWLEGNRYYSVTTAAGDKPRMIFGRTGASDPNFNLTSEPVLIVRDSARDAVFASAIEGHGFFSEPEERSVDAVGKISNVRVISSDADATVVEVTGAENIDWVFMVSNGKPSATAAHRVTAGAHTYEWTGNYRVTGVKHDGK
jgi:oligo-alginate lyase